MESAHNQAGPRPTLVGLRARFNLQTRSLKMLVQCGGHSSRATKRPSIVLQGRGRPSGAEGGYVTWARQGQGHGVGCTVGGNRRGWEGAGGGGGQTDGGKSQLD